jgi:hypothetical protein
VNLISVFTLVQSLITLRATAGYIPVTISSWLFWFFDAHWMVDFLTRSRKDNSSVPRKIHMNAKHLNKSNSSCQVCVCCLLNYVSLFAFLFHFDFPYLNPWMII